MQKSKKSKISKIPKGVPKIPRNDFFSKIMSNLNSPWSFQQELIPHMQKSKNSKISKIQKGVPKIPKNDFFSKIMSNLNSPWSFQQKLIPHVAKKNFQNFSSENHRFFCEFLISMLKSDPIEPKRKKIQKTLLMIKCPKL